MASFPTEIPSAFVTADDGVRLAYREIGSGRPVLLLHGLFSNAQVNWIKFGHAARIAEKGFRVIMPDLRGHGSSDAPHDPTAYPRDILASDAARLIEHLGLTDFDLGGYSLGGRTTMRMLVGGIRPRRAIVAGMGLQGMLDTGHRAAHFRHILENAGRHPRGSNAFYAEAFMKTTGTDPAAALALLGSFADTPEASLREIETDLLVLSGAEDQDNGSAHALAEMLPNARYAEVPGNHMTCITKPEFGAAIAEYLAEPA